MLGPLSRGDEQLASYLRLVRPGGTVVIEAVDQGSLVQALPPGHPYLRFPVQFATALDGVMRKLVDGDELDQLLEDVESELAGPRRWGLTFTLVPSLGTANGMIRSNGQLETAVLDIGRVGPGGHRYDVSQVAAGAEDHSR